MSEEKKKGSTSDIGSSDCLGKGRYDKGGWGERECLQPKGENTERGKEKGKGGKNGVTQRGPSA